MCLTCALAADVSSWIEAGEAKRKDRSRALRLRLLRRALAPHGVHVEASALGTALQLYTAEGAAILTEDMTEVWAFVESVLGAPWDPLAARV